MRQLWFQVKHHGLGCDATIAHPPFSLASRPITSSAHSSHEVRAQAACLSDLLFILVRCLAVSRAYNQQDACLELGAAPFVPRFAPMPRSLLTKLPLGTIATHWRLRLSWGPPGSSSAGSVSPLQMGFFLLHPSLVQWRLGPKAKHLHHHHDGRDVRETVTMIHSFI